MLIFSEGIGCKEYNLHIFILYEWQTDANDYPKVRYHKEITKRVELLMMDFILLRTPTEQAEFSFQLSLEERANSQEPLEVEFVADKEFEFTGTLGSYLININAQKNIIYRTCGRASFLL